jgi:hypothetical protein
MRTRVDDRAEKIYAFLKANLGKPFRGPDLLRRVGLIDNATNRAALRRVKYVADADGLIAPYPVAANSYTYTVTSDPTAAFDPALHLARGQQGLGIPKRLYQDAMKSRMRQMDKRDAAIVTAWTDFEDKVNEVAAGAAALTQAMVAMRREDRDS